jgi:hypothetical protein
LPVETDRPVFPIDPQGIVRFQPTIAVDPPIFPVNRKPTIRFQPSIGIISPKIRLFIDHYSQFTRPARFFRANRGGIETQHYLGR